VNLSDSGISTEDCKMLILCGILSGKCVGITSKSWKNWKNKQDYCQDFRGNLANLETFIPSLVKTSIFGKEQAEGVYLRFEEEDYVVLRCKYRRATFVTGRDSFDTKMENNSIKE